MTSESKQKLDERFRAMQGFALLRSARQAIVTLDPDGRVLESNFVAENLHGLTSQELRGRSYIEFVPTAKQGEFLSALGKLRHKRRLPEIKTCRLTAGGQEIEVDCRVEGLWNEDDELSGFITICTDVTERESMLAELRRSTEHTQAIVQTVVDGIVSIDAKGIITAVNPSTEKMFGYRGHELIGRNVKLLMPEPYHSEHDGYLEHYHKTGERKIIGIGREVHAVRKNGEVFPIDLAVSQLNQKDNAGFVGVMRDITDRKEAARALGLLNSQLQDKVDELGDALEQLQLAQSQLVESEKLASLGSLVAGISHEINTPVGVCVTASSFLAEQTRTVRDLFDADELDADGLLGYFTKVEEAGQILERNLSRAADLIRSFKQVAVDRSSNLRRRFQLKGFIDELLASLSPNIKSSKAKIRVTCAEEIEMDSLPGALSQVLTNLIQNALLHGFAEKTDGVIDINAEVHGERLKLYFRDNGCGMSAQHLKQVFDPFFTTKRGQGGTGLGMSVTYNLVTQALCGELSAQSTLGEGTEFELDLPLHVADEKAEPDIAEKDGAHERA